MTLTTAIAAALICSQAVAPTATELLHRHVQAIGGEQALRAVKSRAIEGTFDNGRGLKTRLRVYEAAPNKRVTLIGTDAIESDGGSGRGYDGSAGWDKNFIGTGLRAVVGSELAALIRDSDVLRALHLLDECASTSVEAGVDDFVICRSSQGTLSRLHFNRASGLLVKHEMPLANGRGSIVTTFEDYRAVDGLRLPFTTRIVLPGATVTYTTESVQYNVPVDDRLFQRPPR